jgi:predicted component of type VI protein secretion system
MSVFKLKGTSGRVINQSVPFRERIVLGSSASCDVQIDEVGVSAKHAEIRLIDGSSLQLKDLRSETGTLLNGEPVIETLLASGDEIRIGTCRWMLQAPGLRPQRILTAEVVGNRHVAGRGCWVGGFWYQRLWH